MIEFQIFSEQATKSGGVVVIVGLSGSTEMKIPIINALFREVDIRGIFRYTNWYVCIAMLFRHIFYCIRIQPFSIFEYLPQNDCFRVLLIFTGSVCE